MTYTRAKIFQFIETGFANGARFDVGAVYKALYAAQKHSPMSTIQHALQEFEKSNLITRVKEPGKRAQFSLVTGVDPHAVQMREALRRRGGARRQQTYYRYPQPTDGDFDD